VQHLQAVDPERPVPRREIRLPAVEFVEVEEEVGLDVPLLPAEVGEPAGEGGGRKRRRCDGVHRCDLQ